MLGSEGVVGGTGVRRVGVAPAGRSWVLLACLVVGCGGSTDPFERVAVEGTVTIGGEPLGRGMIRLTPIAPTEGPKVSLPVVDGRFAGDATVGPVAGRHRVAVEVDESDEFPHDGEEVLEELGRQPAPRRSPRRAEPPAELTHTFTAEDVNLCDFAF